VTCTTAPSDDDEGRSGIRWLLHSSHASPANDGEFRKLRGQLGPSFGLG
jgi:hypothetical protein